jgi:hypothetical protein
MIAHKYDRTRHICARKRHKIELLFGTLSTPAEPLAQPAYSLSVVRVPVAGKRLELVAAH